MTVGIVASGSRESTAVEIDTGKSDLVQNATKCLRMGFYRIILVPIYPANKEVVFSYIKESP
jgi:hypothetical protein